MDYLKKINLIYEDNHLLVVEKPINMPVQKDESKDEDLLNLLKRYIKEKYNKPGEVYLALIHRLDRPVSGIMIFAKTSKAASRLNKQMRIGQINKIYLVIIEGVLTGSGTFEDKLLKNKKTNFVKVDQSGKESILKYKALYSKENKTLVEVDLVTGRSHQIRVQFSSRGFPLVNDNKYNPKAGLGNIGLFAKKISIIHPTLKKRMQFELNLPKEKPFDIFKV